MSKEIKDIDDIIEETPEKESPLEDDYNSIKKPTFKVDKPHVEQFFDKKIIGVLLIIAIISLVFVFAKPSKKQEETNNNTTVKFEPVRFVGDGIVSGKQQAINRTNAIFNYSDNSIYEIYSKVDYVTTIRLQEGEKILFFAGGDTERWVIEETQGGKNNRPLVFIKPNIEDDFDEMSTNINIVTDKHVYFLNIYLSTDKYNPLVEWNYPNE